MLETILFLEIEVPWVMPLLAFIFGSIVGSFLNVCIYRIPMERSIVQPGSTCACGQRIAWYNNIPIFSWLFLRGQASCCEMTFSIRYPVVEALTGLLFSLVWLTHAPLVALVGMLFVSILIAATFIDFDHMIIPDRFSIGGMLLGVILSFGVPELHGLTATGLGAHIESGMLAIIGAIVGAGLVYWIAIIGEIVFRKPAMGEGDVKFLGCIGAFCGWEGALFGMFGGACLGAALLLPVLLLGRIFGWQQNAIGETEASENIKVTFGSQVPFGPMLALGGLIYFLGFSGFVDAYLADFINVFFAL